MDQEELIRGIIDAFFHGEEFFERNIGFVWVAKHGKKKVALGELNDAAQVPYMKPPSLNWVDEDDDHYGYIPEFETLTIEPKQGGQYEVAVRIWSENEWKGYMINDVRDLHSFYLISVNTGGH